MMQQSTVNNNWLVAKNSSISDNLCELNLETQNQQQEETQASQQNNQFQLNNHRHNDNPLEYSEPLHSVNAQNLFAPQNVNNGILRISEDAPVDKHHKTIYDISQVSGDSHFGAAQEKYANKFSQKKKSSDEEIFLDNIAIAVSPPEAFKNHYLQSIANPPFASHATATTIDSLNAFEPTLEEQHFRTPFVPVTTVAPILSEAQYINAINMMPPPPNFANTITNTHFRNPSSMESNRIQSLPNYERNQYLKTSHFSDNSDKELHNQSENLPPPGLSRYVLGQPELEVLQRLVTGTEDLNPDLNIEERHADGQDTSLEDVFPSNVVNCTAHSTISENESIEDSINITSPHSNIFDRNLYLVPGESNTHNEQRVVTGIETNILPNSSAIRNQEREIQLDGENLEDPQTTPIMSRNEQYLEGTVLNFHALGNQLSTEFTETYQQSKCKDLANSTADNSDHIAKHIITTQKPMEVEKGHLEKYRKSKKPPLHLQETDDSEEFKAERDHMNFKNYDETNLRGKHLEYHEKNRRNRDKKENNDKADREKVLEKYYSEQEVERYYRKSKPYRNYDVDAKCNEEDPSCLDPSPKDLQRRVGRSSQQAENRSERSDRSDPDFERYHRSYRESKRVNLDANRASTRQHARGRYINEYDTTKRRRDKQKLNLTNPRNYEVYRTQSSRNARGSDAEKDHDNGGHTESLYDPHHSAFYGIHSTYGYDPYSFYFNHIARTHPQTYSDWLKKYYGPAAANAMLSPFGIPADPLTSSISATDGRESVHSGRSSVQNDKDRYRKLSLRTAELNMIDPQRLTPWKFTNEHSVASFSTGILVTVQSKYAPYSGVNNIVKLLRVDIYDSTHQLFLAFPGPLIRGQTHKKTIIEFCEDRIRFGPEKHETQTQSSNLEISRASYTLLWNLLILLLRQNGMVIGTDIAELLLKNQQQFPYEPNSANSTYSELPLDKNETQSKTVGPEQKIGKSTTNNYFLNSSQLDNDESNNICENSIPSEDEVTEKFRNYLLYGNVNEALDWATDNNLWGHALFLASKVDRRAHANVMMKFANKLALNDPLQTLYQLMSGRTPSSVTSVQDEKWGDWRPHLSMILSNTSQKPELDRKAITSLGDSLFNRCDLFAAHFCYLMAQTTFGRYQNCDTFETVLQQTLPKLVLLGSSHYQDFQNFATNEAIIMTEIYEYACSFNDDKFFLVEFQPYKYLLATRLFDYGYSLKSLLYLEQIAEQLKKNPDNYETTFIKKVYELADRLKYYDPAVLEKSEEKINSSSSNHLIFEEQIWLQNLREIVFQKQDNTYEPNKNLGVEFAKINKQFEHLNLQRNTDYVDVQQTFEFTDINTSCNQIELPQIQQLKSQQQTGAGIIDHQEIAAGLSQNTFGDVLIEQASNIATDSLQGKNYLHPDQQQNPYYDSIQTHQLSAEHCDMSSFKTLPGNYENCGQTEKNMENQNDNIVLPRPYVSIGKTNNNEPEGKTHSGNLQLQNQNSEVKKYVLLPDQNRKGSKFMNNSSQSHQNSGWFGGIWNKLSLKPKNQMILPDDKNPTIVWDSERKQWINTDSEEKVDTAPKPPPKMTEIVQPQTLQAITQEDLSAYYKHAPVSKEDNSSYTNITSDFDFSTSSVNATIKTNDIGLKKVPNLQSNMFKMQRNRTLKSSYVDVFNPSGRPVSNETDKVLAPTLPPSAVPQEGFFIPYISDLNDNQQKVLQKDAS